MVIVLSYLMFSVVFFSCYLIGEVSHAYQGEIAANTADYEFGNCYTPYASNHLISEEKLERLQNVYGVAGVEATKGHTYVSMNWEGIEHSNYVEQLSQSYWPIYSDTDAPQAFLVGVELEKELYHYYEQEVDEGRINLEAFARGKEVILYLPECYYSKEGTYLGDLNQVRLKGEELLRIQEQDIKVGKEIVLNGHKVKVGAIIRDIEEDVQRKVVAPYMVIGSYDLYYSVIGEDHSFGYVQLNTQDLVDNQQVEAELTQIKMGVPLMNYHEKKTELFHSFWRETFLIVLSACMCVLIIRQCRKSFWEVYVTQNQMLWKDYWQLGVSKRRLSLNYMSVWSFRFGYGMIASYLSVGFYHLVRYYSRRNVGALGNKELIDGMFFEDFIMKMTWMNLGWCVFGVGFCIFVSEMIAVKKFLNNLKM